ncbi:MAG: GNAT family N-acetyltransferase [bacterium]|nr:GNAT family N-acetyltransferase [bacterium]
MKDILNTNYTITTLNSNQLIQAQKFYKSVGYINQIVPTDKVLIALENNAIIGIVRLSYEEGTCTLRGMQIKHNYQRQGVGTALLKKLNILIGTDTCWCIPHDWLENFYGQIGFQKITEKEAPLFLQKRIKEVRKCYPYVMVMVKNRGETPKKEVIRAF